VAGEVGPLARGDTAPSGPPAEQGLSARAARGGRWVGAAALVSNGTAAAVLLLLAAVLPPRDLGVLALGTMVFVVANMLQDFGLFDVLVYTPHRVREAAETVLLCWLVAGSVLGALIVAGSSWLAGFFGDDRAAPVIAVAAVLLLCHAAAGVPFALWTRALQLRRRSQVQMAAVLLGGFTTVALVAAGLGIAAMVIGQVVQAVLLVVAAWTLGPRVRPRWHGDVAGELFAYGRHAFGASVTTVLQTNVDYVVVGRVLGAAALGVYSFSFRFAFLPHAVISLVVASTLFALLCRVEGPASADAVMRYTRTVLVLLTPLVAGLALFAPAVTLLGDEWRDGVEALRWLALFCLFTSVVTLTVFGLKGIGLPRRAFAVSGLHLGVLTGLLLAVAGRGLDAVSVARVAAASAAAALGWWWLARGVGVSPWRLSSLLRLPLLGTLAMTVVAVALPFSVAGRGEVTWLAAAPQGLATLVAYVIAVGLADRSALREAAGRVLRRGDGS
jgi:PST family polysaccharide transporter